MGFKDELLVAFNELQQKTSEINKRADEVGIQGLDSAFNVERKKVVMEYNKKLISLKEKHGIELSEREVELKGIYIKYEGLN